MIFLWAIRAGRSCRELSGGERERDLDARNGALAGRADQREAAAGAVEHAQALVDVAEADARRERLRHALVGNPQAVVFDLDDREAAFAAAADGDRARTDLA